MASATLKAAAVLTAAGALAIGGWHWAAHWRPSPQTYPLQGVDTGLDAAVIAWSSVRAAGADFAYLTATAGVSRRSPSFEANWQALPDAGMRRGAVHLLSLCQDGRAQADAFNAVVPQAADALPPAVDVGLRDDCPAPVKPGEQLDRFVAAVEAHSGKPVVLRISRAAERRFHLAAGLDRPVWALGNLVSPGYAPRPWRLWRASDLRRVEGVADPINWDVVAP